MIFNETPVEEIEPDGNSDSKIEQTQQTKKKGDKPRAYINQFNAELIQFIKPEFIQFGCIIKPNQFQAKTHPRPTKE